MIRTECERCGERLPRAGRGRPPQFCSTRCRVAAHRASRANVPSSAVPAELRERARWVRRAADKAPLTAGGRAASSTDPATWAPYEAAAASEVGVGLGFVLDGDGIVCLDLDHCVDERGRVADWAADIVAACPATYTEISPSGTGLHLWGYGNVVRGRRIRRPDGTALEVYGTGRYIALGRHDGASPLALADLSQVIDTLI